MNWYDAVIHYSLWFVFFVGLWLMVYPLIIPNIKISKFKRLLQVNREKRTNKVYFVKIEKLLNATLNVKGNFAVYSFLFVLLMIALMTFVGLLKSGRSGIEVVIWTILTPFIPVGFLFYRLRQLRVNTSHEGQFMVNELLNNYRIFHMNITEAIDHTVLNLDHYPNSKRVLSRLAMGLKEYKNENELEKLIEEFRYSIDTTWGELLGILILNASLYGDDIKEGLMDIINELRNLERLNEKNKQSNVEGELMLKILIPIMILGSFYGMFKWFGFTFKKYVEYQFENSTGFTTFFYSLIAICVTYLLHLFLKKEKNDY